MDLLVSGLAKDDGMAKARSIHGSRPLAWIEPDAIASLAEKPATRELVWTYQLPWQYVASSQLPAQEALHYWTVVNRRALNLRKALGKNISFLSTAPTQARENEDTVLYQLAAVTAPQVFEVLSMLELSGPSPVLQEGGSSWVGEAVLASVCRIANSGASRMQEGGATKVGSGESMSDKDKQNDAEEERKRMQAQLTELSSRNQRLQDGESQLKGELALVQGKLRETHVLLEQQYLRVKSLENELKTERARAANYVKSHEALLGEQSKRETLERDRDALLRRIEGYNERLGRLQGKLEEALCQAASAQQAGGLVGRLKNVLRSLRSGRRAEAEGALEVRRLEECHWFDPEWYLASNPDVRLSGANAVEHYVNHGWKEGRNPGPKFDTNFYLEEYEDVRKSGMNPLYHFVEFGLAEGRLPARNPD